MHPGRVVSTVSQALIEASKALANLDGELIDALAAHVCAMRFGPGIEGLVAGQGLTLRVAPPGVPGFASSGFLVVTRGASADDDRVAVLFELARAVLVAAKTPRTSADVAHLALAIGAPRALVERLRAEGRLTPVNLAAETGLPVVVAGWRIDSLRLY